MILAFDPEHHLLNAVADVPSSGWVHAAAPTPDELALLHDKLGIPKDFLRHAVDIDEVARIDRDESGAILVMLRVPHREKPGHDLPYRAVPLAVVLLDGVLVTISPIETELIADLLESKVITPHEHPRIVIRLILRAAERFLGYVGEINRAVDTLEDELQASLRNREVLELLKYQKALVHITTALDSDQILVDRLQNTPHLKLSQTAQGLLGDARVELQQAVEMAAISSNILSQLMDAFASIISNNLNIVMKVLTSLTIILALPTMVASFYGMNVGLPAQQHPAAFWMVIGLSVVISSLVVLVFWRKRWL